MAHNRCVVDVVKTVSVSTMPPADPMSQVAVAVDTSSTIIQAANSSRQYLLVQNRGDTPVYVVVSGAAATVAAGVQILPGDAYEWDTKVPLQNVTAIRDAGAPTEDVVVVEG